MERIVKLCEIKENKKTVVYSIENFDEKMVRRLNELGFVKNQKVEVLKNFKKGKNMLLSVRGALLALDYLLAEKVYVYER